MEGQTTGASPEPGPGPGSPVSGSGPPGPRANPPAAGSDSTLKRLWWLWVLIGVVAVFLIAFFIGRATNQETVAETTTTTTASVMVPVKAPTMVITERQNGKTVIVGTGWVVLVQLTGNPDDGSVWAVQPVDRSLIQVLPGPQISTVDYATPPEAVYTYSGLTIDIGDVKVEARNVSATGKVNKTFACTIKIESASDVATTTTLATTTTVAPTTTTKASTTTTAAAGTTTTAAKTTTTKAPTTTTSKASTTTTSKPSTSTTVTTEPPTSTTLRPTTTTTVPKPPINIPDGAVPIGPKSNGQTKVVATTATAVIFALPDDTSDGSIWHLSPVDATVLKQQGDPEFVPSTPGSSQGALVWTFSVVGPGDTVLQAEYADASGTVSQAFFCTVSVQELTVTPY
jgi:predicted secreted protein